MNRKTLGIIVITMIFLIGISFISAEFMNYYGRITARIEIKDPNLKDTENQILNEFTLMTSSGLESNYSEINNTLQNQSSENNQTDENSNNDKQETNSTEIILGCTDSEAINYNSNATEDDGSCEFNSTGEETNTTENINETNSDEENSNEGETGGSNEGDASEEINSNETNDEI